MSEHGERRARTTSLSLPAGFQRVCQCVALHLLFFDKTFDRAASPSRTIKI